jgi:hypothetical protein
MAVFSAAIKGSLSIVTEAAGAVYATGAVVSGAMGLALLAADIVCPPLFVCSVIGGLVAWAARSNSKQLKGEAAGRCPHHVKFITNGTPFVTQRISSVFSAILIASSKRNK